jgi:hypothetical protein
MFAFLINRKVLSWLIIMTAVAIRSITITVINTNDAGAGSLRQAITTANGSVGNDLINFNLGAGGPFTITLLSALPNLTDNSGVTIDGWDNGANPGTPNSTAVFSTSVGTPLNPVYKIVLGNGANIPVGMTIASTNNLVRGLVFFDFGDGTPSNNDICVNITAASNTLVGCYIGMSWDGVTAGTKPYIGVQVGAANNLIGDGTNAGVNLISGLGGAWGYKIYFQGAATANRIKGNIIGLKADGATAMLTNTSQGIALWSPANSNTIGGLGAGDGNLISGNYGTGISISSNSNVIQGNYIGPLGDGVSGLVGTMQSNGMSNGGSYNLIGGSVPAARNIISGNTNLGMDMSGTNNIVRGNYWGTTKTGLAKISAGANSGLAVNTGTGNIIGGPNAGDGNLMAGLPGMAIWLLFNVAPVTTVVQGNTIGIAANGTSSLTGGNTGTGILMMLNTCNNIIGGSTATERNIISSAGTGISIGNQTGGGNIFKGNYIGCSGPGTNYITGSSQWSGLSVQGVSITNNVPNVIGGTGAGEGNVISGNQGYGIQLSSIAASLTVIQQNTIGPQANGTSMLVGGNPQQGIYITNSWTNTIGGSAANAQNIISGNATQGIMIDGVSSKFNKVTGNLIGPGAGGVSIAGSNQTRGVVLQNSASTNSIGGYLGSFGLNPQGNTIAYNITDGVYMFNTGTDSNLVSRNLIYLNGAGSLPINLNYGANQGNQGKAVPVIVSAAPSIVTGSAAATAGVGDTVEVFSNNTGNCRDLMVYHGSTVALGTGDWTLTGVSIPNGSSVIATARSIGSRNTSQASTCTVVLPIELLNFYAVCGPGQIIIRWNTMTESNTDSFILEKTSDGYNYTKVGTISAAGKSREKKEYTIIDKAPNKGVNTYRLRQRDRDGSETLYYAYSADNCDTKPFALDIFPNPASTNLTISLGFAEEHLTSYSITEMAGKVIKSGETRIYNGKGDLDLSELPAGMYLIKAECEGYSFMNKFVKE